MRKLHMNVEKHFIYKNDKNDKLGGELRHRNNIYLTSYIYMSCIFAYTERDIWFMSWKTQHYQEITCVQDDQ